MSQESIKEEEAVGRFAEALEKAQSAGVWMAAVWEVRDKKISLVGRTACKFPQGDYLRALVKLTESLADEVFPDQQPLPERPELLPRVVPDVPDIKVFPPVDEIEEAETKACPVQAGALVGDKGTLPNPPPPCNTQPSDVPPPVGFPNPAAPSLEVVQCRLEKLPEVTVEKTNTAVILSAEGALPLALPVDVTEFQITEAVENYRAGLGASQ